MGFISDAARKITMHAESADAHTYNPLSSVRTGEYYGGGCGSPRSWTVPLVSGRMYAVPFAAARAVSVDRIAVYVSSPQVDRSLRLGIYGNGANVCPGALLIDGGEVSAATDGLKEVAINLALGRGLYWMALVSDGTPAVRGYGQSACTVSALTSMSDGLEYETGWYADSGYAALPDPFGTASKHAGTSLPGISLRVAGLG